MTPSLRQATGFCILLCRDTDSEEVLQLNFNNSDKANISCCKFFGHTSDSFKGVIVGLCFLSWWPDHLSTWKCQPSRQTWWANWNYRVGLQGWTMNSWKMFSPHHANETDEWELAAFLCVMEAGIVHAMSLNDENRRVCKGDIWYSSSLWQLSPTHTFGTNTRASSLLETSKGYTSC